MENKSLWTAIGSILSVIIYDETKRRNRTTRLENRGFRDAFTMFKTFHLPNDKKKITAAITTYSREKLSI